MILPIYWGELFEVHHVFACGEEDEFQIDILLNIHRVFSALNLELIGTSKIKTRQPLI